MFSRQSFTATELDTALRGWDGREAFPALADQKATVAIAAELKKIRHAFMSNRLPPHASLSEDCDWALESLKQSYPQISSGALRSLENDYIAANCHG